MYHLGRDKLVSICGNKCDIILPWTVFQLVIESGRLSNRAQIVFNVIIMAPPKAFDIAYTILKHTQEQMIALGQEFDHKTFDMGLLPKALEIVWAIPEEFSGFIPIEGGMHYMKALMSGIGHVLVNSNVFFKKLSAEHILFGRL